MNDKKIIDMDGVRMYSELWYLQDYKKDYTQEVKSYGASGNTTFLENFLPWTIPENSIAQVEIHDSVRNRWYELTDYQDIEVGTNQVYGISPVVQGNKAGVSIRRNNFSGASRPGITFTIRLRTFRPPFIV